MFSLRVLNVLVSTGILRNCSNGVNFLLNSGSPYRNNSLINVTFNLISLILSSVKGEQNIQAGFDMDKTCNNSSVTIK